MAGLMAARFLVDHGVGVELLEAKPHVGGRVITAHPDAPRTLAAKVRRAAG